MHDNTPVLIRAGRFTHRGKAAEAPTPPQLIKILAEKAAADAGLDAGALGALDTIGVVGFSVDAGGARMTFATSSFRIDQA